MNIYTIRKLAVASILAFSFLLSAAAFHAEAAANDSSIRFKQDSSGLFTLTIKDPDGIQEFSLSLVGRYRYGGTLSSCPTSYVSENASFVGNDFEPVMPAYIIDCKNNKIELEIAPPVNGIAASVAAKKEVPPPPPPAPPKEEKKEGLVPSSIEGPLSAEDIQYPISDLGDCQNEIECRSYCDNAARAKECFTFAKKYNLISPEEAEKATDNFLNIKNGPGGCNSGSSCEAYCNNIDHLDACIAFAEESGYYSGSELAEAKKFQALVKAGKEFPGDCQDRNACEIYCGDPTHMEECLNFAEESGFMDKEEIDEARKFMTLMRQGESPGGCTSKESCENYCFEEGHSDECITFAEKAGVMSAEEAAMARKVGGKGPGGCHSRAQCDAYCQENSDECFRFAQENGLISEDDLAQMTKGMEQFRDNLDKMPPEAVQCLQNAVGEENFNKIKNGQPVFDRAMEGKMKSCFTEITANFSQQVNQLPPEATQCIKDAVGEDAFQKLQKGEPSEDLDFDSLDACFQQLQKSFGGGGNFGDGGFSGPGGCKNTEECTAYCQANPQECQGFGPPGGDQPSGGGGFPGGPGGCQSQDECTAYCEDHPNECQGFGPPSDGSGGGGTGGGGGFSGPGGCTNQETCMTYCQDHYTDPACSAYGGGGGGIPPPSPISSCIKPPEGLVSWWSADMVSGNTVSDINSYHSNNGTISGGVTIVPMEVGSAFKFDGSSGYISMGNPESLNFGTGPVSLEAWFNWDGGGNSGALNIIRKSNYPVSGPGSGYWLRIGRDSSLVEFSVGATTGPEGQSIITAPIRAGIWHHVVATRDDSGVIALYVDGEARGTIIRQAASANAISEAPFTLGAWNDRFGITELFPGTIDEVAVYIKALSASEVRALFEAGSVGKCSASFGHTDREPYQEPPPPSFSGPGGCKSEQECITYCMANPQDSGCTSYQRSSPTETPATPPPSGDQTSQEYCSSFASVPQCSYVGAPDSENYQLCKKCYPDK